MSRSVDTFSRRFFEYLKQPEALGLELLYAPPDPRLFATTAQAKGSDGAAKSSDGGAPRAASAR